MALLCHAVRGFNAILTQARSRGFLHLCGMALKFFKYQGAGNDFVLLDNRSQSIVLDAHEVAAMCNRHFGIGADGLMLLEPSGAADFKMVYYNSDGNRSTMCGNGGRCIALFAHHLGVSGRTGTLEAIDGVHTFQILPADRVELSMMPVSNVEYLVNDLFINTGSPHHIVVVDELEELDILAPARAIRYSDHYAPGGTNVNFVKRLPQGIALRTYERGVEDETLACGTGVTAAALAAYALGWTHQSMVFVKSRGGDLEVRFTPLDEGFKDIFLTGPAVKVFEGVWP